MSDLTLNKANTALVVIDLQKGITSMSTEPYDTKTVISNAVKLANAFRENKMPVFLVHVSFSKGTSLQPIADLAMPSRGEMPADWADIVPELGPAPSDVVITKRQWGAFYGTDLDLRLRRGGVDNIQTNITRITHVKLGTNVQKNTFLYLISWLHFANLY